MTYGRGIRLQDYRQELVISQRAAPYSSGTQFGHHISYKGLKTIHRRRHEGCMFAVA